MFRLVFFAVFLAIITGFVVVSVINRGFRQKFYEKLEKQANNNIVLYGILGVFALFLIIFITAALILI